MKVMQLWAPWMEKKPLTKEEMEMEIASSMVQEPPHQEFSDQSISETLQALNLRDQNVPTQDPV